MTKNIYFFLILFLLSGCSFDTRSGIWTQEKKLVETNQNEKQKSKEFFIQIINLKNANQDIIKEAQKRLNRDLSE